MGVIVGIDLGTTFSAIAKLDDTGRPEIIADTDASSGSRLVPSVVEFTSPSSYVVGAGAKSQIGINDEYIASEVKRHMGTDKKYDFYGQTHTPTSISGLILKKLKENVEKTYGSIDSVVVTVPANFLELAREETQKAANMAGLNADYIIDEPTAAAFAYAFQSGKDLNGTFVIYDLGGGTFDCSIAQISGQDIKILTSEGVQKLGGKDFDKQITKLVSKKYKEITGDEIPPLEFTSNDAENIKIQLSSRDKASAKIRGEIMPITRDEFEDEISNLVLQAELAVETALSRTDLDASSITDVILVGGSTRIPMIQNSIKDIFGKEAKLFGNPDESVALGASIYAAYKSDKSKLNPLQRKAMSNVSISMAAPFYYGTIITVADTGEQINKVIIPKDERIPCSISDDFFTLIDNQVGLSCIITAAGAEETDPEFVEIVYKGLLELPGGRPEGQPLKYTYSFTENGTMMASFLDVKSGNILEKTIDSIFETSDDNSDDVIDIEDMNSE